MDAENKKDNIEGFSDNETYHSEYIGISLTKEFPKEAAELMSIIMKTKLTRCTVKKYVINNKYCTYHVMNTCVYSLITGDGGCVYSRSMKVSNVKENQPTLY